VARLIFHPEAKDELARAIPYGIIYRVDDDEVFIAAVMHFKRTPGYWKQRTSSVAG